MTNDPTPSPSIEELREHGENVRMAAERLSIEAQLRSTGMKGEEERLRSKMGSIAADLFGLDETLDATIASLLADQARLVEDARLIRDAWGALNFILAFYEPGQRYLDTEAWKNAEARGRAVHARLAERMAALTPDKPEIGEGG